MKLEEQVVSLELSRHLKKAGYVQEGLWWWRPFYDVVEAWANKESDKGLTPTSYKLLLEDKSKNYRSFVAPTVAELGERLPMNCEFGKTDTIDEKSPIRWRATYAYADELPAYANTEANARAFMWLYLKKEKFL